MKMPGNDFWRHGQKSLRACPDKRIDTSRALALPGVVAVITAEELNAVQTSLDANAGG